MQIRFCLVPASTPLMAPHCLQDIRPHFFARHSSLSVICALPSSPSSSPLLPSICSQQQPRWATHTPLNIPCSFTPLPAHVSTWPCLLLLHPSPTLLANPSLALPTQVAPPPPPLVPAGASRGLFLHMSLSYAVPHLMVDFSTMQRAPGQGLWPSELPLGATGTVPVSVG